MIITRNNEYFEKDITEEEFNNSTWPGKGWTIYTGEWPIPPESLTLTEAKTKKEAEIRAKGSALMLQITTPYSAEERDTWPIQTAEAHAFTANNSASTPLLSALVTNRGVTLQEQVTRILANEAAFRVAVGTALGLQQNKIDQIAICETVAEVEMIQW